MKKNYTLLSGLVLGSVFAFAQTAIPQQVLDSEVKAKLSSNPLEVEEGAINKAPHNSKLFRDTAFYEQFANGIPAGWSVVNNNANNFQWVWNNTYQNGQFSTGTPAVASTTSANGFMVLTGDFFNTPIPPGGAVTMDTYFESPDINFTSTLPGVWVTYQQSLRYCCSSANRLVLQVSNDNFLTFDEFDATDGIAVNAATGTVNNVINISSVAANQSSIKIRFLSEGNSHYYWMIDDFAVIEGPANDLELTTPYMEFHEANYTYYPFYGQIPYDLFPPLPFFGTIKNNGHATQTAVFLEADVTHTGGPAGAPAQGIQYSNATFTNPSTVLADSSYAVLTGNPRFVPTILGDFQVDFRAGGDSIDENIGNETAIATFSTTDTIFARDDNAFGGGTGPGSYVDGASGNPGGTAPGDRFAIKYIIESNSGNGGLTKVPTSVTFYVSADAANIGAEIIPKIWEVDEDSLFINGGSFSVDRHFGAEVASSFVPYTVTANDTNSFITLPLDNGSGVFNGLMDGEYAVGWEQVSLGPNSTSVFEVANDATSAALQVAVSTFVYHGHSPGWGWVRANPVIRLNMGNLPVSTGINNNNESNVALNVSPNPNNGEFKLNISTESNVQFNLNVRNVLGQVVYSDILNVNGSTTENLDLTSFEKGIYFVSLENGSERLLKKVVVK